MIALVSTYELGRQPFGLASPAAWLTRAGFDVTCLDLSRQPFDPSISAADLVAFHLPMHTATRLAVPVIARLRDLNPNVEICGYGLYAFLNEAFLRSIGVSHILGAEYEADLVRLAMNEAPLMASEGGIQRLKFVTPNRDTLPPLTQYATLQHGAQRRVVGYTEASRGCKHTCRHCPIVPVYEGQFRIIPVDVVMADIERQIEKGAEHVTFGDPDFLNGIGHARRVMQAVARRFPELTYDVTVKVEHLLQHRQLIPELRNTGCVFITSAVESFDDAVLERLQKGHTRGDVERAVDICRTAGVPIAPTFVAFNPWTTLDSYRDFLTEIDRLELVDNVAPIQLGIRLLVTSGSRLVDLNDSDLCLGSYDESRLLYPWCHKDPLIDQLGDDIGALIGRNLRVPRQVIFNEVWKRAHHGVESAVRKSYGQRQRTEVPYLNEPWYC
ncbi:MAG: CUAEP/CCAEP-tail radical SAM protein [Acidobacteriota bacterium]|nr:CUAEP/CCAEP-tail radical SAM protein [Acidobacteriota bacterium]